MSALGNSEPSQLVAPPERRNQHRQRQKPDTSMFSELHVIASRLKKRTTGPPAARTALALGAFYCLRDRTFEGNPCTARNITRGWRKVYDPGFESSMIGQYGAAGMLRKTQPNEAFILHLVMFAPHFAWGYPGVSEARYATSQRQHRQIVSHGECLHQVWIYLKSVYRFEGRFLMGGFPCLDTVVPSRYQLSFRRRNTVEKLFQILPCPPRSHSVSHYSVRWRPQQRPSVKAASTGLARGHKLML